MNLFLSMSKQRGLVQPVEVESNTVALPDSVTLSHSLHEYLLVTTIFRERSAQVLETVYLIALYSICVDLFLWCPIMTLFSSVLTSISYVLELSISLFGSSAIKSITAKCRLQRGILSIEMVVMKSLT